MRNPITPGLIAFKRAVTESIYTGRMTVRDPVWETEPDSGFQTERLAVTAADVPCRVIAQHMETIKENPREVYKMLGVLLPPDIPVSAGSRLTITFNGRTADYRLTSDPQRYTGHQRINTRLWDDNDRHYA